MNKKTTTLILLLFLSVLGVKADVIPSSYYSAIGEGTFYIYDVTDQKFMRKGDGGSVNRIAFETTPSMTFTLASGENSGYTIKIDATSTYMIWNHAGEKTSWGSDFWLDANGVKDEGSGQYCAWSFTDFNTKTYKISTNYSYGGSTERTGGTAKYLQGGVWSTDNVASAHEYALITVENYEKYYYNSLAASASISATYFTTTPAVGTYYLYSPYSSCFLYATDDRAGFQNTPAEVTLTANGDDFNIQFSNGKYLKYDAIKQGNTWANGNVGEAWSFTSFHGADGLFFIKHVSANSFLYAMNSSANAWGGECWGTAETGNTRFAWALVSASDYENWQNSFVLNETDAVGFSSTRDIYNVNPTVNRSMTANVWNTLVVPFDMTIPSGWEVMEPTSFSNSELTFGTASSIVHGKPYIVKPSEAVTSFSATGVTLYKDLQNTSVSEGALTMTGTYEAGPVPTDRYIIGIKNDESNLYKVNSSVTIKPFRAYFTVSGEASARIAINFDDDEVTGITLQEIENESGNAGMKDGKYFENGKIIIVKNGVKYSVNGSILK